MINEKHIELFRLLNQLNLVNRDYLEIVVEGWGGLNQIPLKDREKTIKEFKEEMVKAKGVVGCFDWISHIENIYKKLEEFFKEVKC